MHELSIVQSIVDTAEEKVRENNAQYVEHIELVIGALAGVDSHALDFAWEVGVKNTVLESAFRKVISVPGKAKCLECDVAFEIKEIFEPCPICGEHLLQIVGGKELQIRSLTLN